MSGIAAAMHWSAARSGFDEVFARGRVPRPHYAPLIGILDGFTREDISRREHLQRLALMNHGSPSPCIDPFDLPVFPEIPERRREPALDPSAEAALQQQEEP